MNEPTEELRILILEDVATDAELEVQTLREAGLDFVSLRVDTEVAFIRALQEFSPHIVLSDYRLPAYSGRDALEYMRREYPQIPVIMVTGALGDEAAVELLKSGARDYVLKERLVRLAPAIRRVQSEEKDIHNRKLAEDKYRTLFENAPMCVHEINLDGRIASMNPACQRMLAVNEEDEVRGLYYPDVVSDADRERIMTMLAKANAGETSHFEYKAKGTGESIFKSCIIPIKNKKGEVEKLMGITEDITDRKAAEIRLGFLAHHDRLTGLPNRELFYDRLSQSISQARRKSERLVVLYLDLDGFKAINDNLGHEAGDDVLRMVAQRLQACVRDMDTVARVGGDEFVIILDEMGHMIDAGNISEKIIHALSEPMKFQGNIECQIGVSIGIAFYPLNGTEIDKLMNAADIAMYKSKERGKNCYTFFNGLSSGKDLIEPWIILDSSRLVGVREIDQQHQQIVELLNKLDTAVNNNAEENVIAPLLDEVISFARSHFDTEDGLMDKYEYPGSFEHKEEHQSLLNDVVRLKKKFLEGGEWVVLQELKDWFLLHITNLDKPLATFLVKHGVE